MLAVATQTTFRSVTIKPCLIRHRRRTFANAAVRTVTLLCHILPKYHHNILTYHKNSFWDRKVRGVGVAVALKVRTSAMLLLLIIGN
jgi:hypothetical protein